MRLIFLPLFLVAFLSFHSFAQVQKKYREYGDALMEQGDYKSAAIYYQKAMEIDSIDVGLLYAYGLSQKKSNNYEKALFYFQKVRRADRRRNYIMARFHLAEVYKHLQLYDKAVKEYSYFKKRYKGDHSHYTYLKAENEIAQYGELRKMMHDTVGLDLSNAHPVNTVQSEFSGYFPDDTTLIFSSLRSEKIQKEVVLDSNTYFTRIYVSGLKDSLWSAGISHPAYGEHEQLDVANAVYSPKQEYVYYSECKMGKCKIFRARNDTGQWTDFKELPDKINLPGTNNSQPYMARVNGFDLLFFASNRKGGYGQFDIWYCIAYSNGLYSDPINMGEAINTPGNDICPFFMTDENALYFSSDFHLGIGGYDIFRSVLKDEVYQYPENLGVPLNSSYNDLYFRYNNGKAVLTSNRLGSLTDKHQHCCNDLYFFDYQPRMIVPEAEMTRLEKINRLLPVRLFFDNDEPGRGSRDTITTLLFSALYINYVRRDEMYAREYAKGLRKADRDEAENEMNRFFEDEIKLGYEYLKEALGLLAEELNDGTNITLAIKGFASPLSDADYNRRLTLRRINAVENEIMHFNGGILKPYIENGQLILERQPFGEDQAARDVSDDLTDKRNAVYSKKAAFERRVEIISVEER